MSKFGTRASGFSNFLIFLNSPFNKINLQLWKIADTKNYDNLLFE